jgi:UDP-N-acetylmuramate--L-alanine ligase/UDP-N-acetylenolpyruvoylglucosamine reductase
MSALAVYLHERGCVVSGCDEGNAATLEEIRDLGVDVAFEHDEAHVATSEVVLWSPAVAPDHVELVGARRRSLVMLARRSVLAELSRHTRVIGITGTHGKTTATSMLVQIMRSARRDDARLLGASVRSVGFGGHYAPGDLLAEIDESYGAFSELTPYALGLTNVEADHLDHYGSLENLESAFVDVLERTTGPVVVWSDDAGASRVAAKVQRPVITVGTSEEAHWRLSHVEISRTRARARLTGETTLEIALSVTGRHNLANAAVAAVLALSLGVAPSSVREGLTRFGGAPRRFELVAHRAGVDVIDDYAHLPGEIAATIAAARDAGYRKVVAVFQPHRVSRTLAIGSEFAPAFDDADEVIVTDIYTAGEANPAAITGEVVAASLRSRATTRVHYAPTLEVAASILEGVMDNADVVLILGAGDVTRVLDYLSATTVAGVSPSDHAWGDDPRIQYHASLANLCTYRVGGSVRALVTLSSESDLEDFSQRLDSEERLWIVGNGSNLLVADAEHDVVAVHLVGEFGALDVQESSGDRVIVLAGAALDLPVAARRLSAEGVVGFEWAVGVPGTFGGAVAMNAGGHGSDMRASVRRVQVWSSGELRWRSAPEMSFSYRSSSLGPGEIVTRVELELRRGDATLAREQITQIVKWRRENQPGGANAGSVFRNPEGDHAGRLIDAAGLKGARVGSAAVSDKHANFIIADAQGRANDVWALMDLMRRRVGESTGVWLTTEHRLLGFAETW